MIDRRCAVAALALSSGLCPAAPVPACMLRMHRFSDIQALSPELGELLRTRPLQADWRDLVDGLHAPPPAQHEICAELRELHRLARLRPLHADDIRAEVHTANFRFDGLRLSAAAARVAFPVTLRFLSYLLFLSEPLIHSAKVHFDRARPSHADPGLTTELPVPRHAAFPSGHAFQATLMAEVLSRLAPRRRAQFMADARRIAVNREIAGLHYPSDGLAGEQLAHNFLGRLASTEHWFGAIAKRAALEWKG